MAIRNAKKIFTETKINFFLVLVFVATEVQALSSQTATLQSPYSWVTGARELHMGYEIRRGKYSLNSKISGYWWGNEMSLKDSTDSQILGYGANISGKRYLSLTKLYYFEVSGGYTEFNKGFTGERFSYFSGGGFIGRKFNINWFSIDMNFGIMIPSRTPKQLEESEIGGHPSIMPFQIAGELAKTAIKNFMPNSYLEADLLFGVNF